MNNQEIIHDAWKRSDFDIEKMKDGHTVRAMKRPEKCVEVYDRNTIVKSPFHYPDTSIFFHMRREGLGSSKHYLVIGTHDGETCQVCTVP